MGLKIFTISRVNHPAKCKVWWMSRDVDVKNQDLDSWSNVITKCGSNYRHKYMICILLS